MGPIDVYLVRYFIEYESFLPTVSPLSSPLYTSFLTITLVYSSQFEEKFEEINGVEAPASIPPELPVTECQATVVVPEESRENATDMQGQETRTICPNENESHDIVNGIMKIVPDVDVSRHFNMFFSHPCLSRNKYLSRYLSLLIYLLL